MDKTAINREQQGLIIANMNSAIKRINETKYIVESQNDGSEQDICSTDSGRVCSCPDHKFRGAKCKHIFTVEIICVTQRIRSRAMQNPSRVSNISQLFSAAHGLEEKNASRKMWNNI